MTIPVFLQEGEREIRSHGNSSSPSLRPAGKQVSCPSLVLQEFSFKCGIDRWSTASMGSREGLGGNRQLSSSLFKSPIDGSDIANLFLAAYLQWCRHLHVLVFCLRSSLRCNRIERMAESCGDRSPRTTNSVRSQSSVISLDNSEPACG